MSPSDVNTAYQFFISKGYSPAAASGIVGNLIAESNLSPTIVGDEGQARGIAQWHPDRWANLVAFAGTQQPDFMQQLKFVDHELRTSYPQVFAKVINAAHPTEAAGHFGVGYEVPEGSEKGPTGMHRWDVRSDAANKTFALGTGADPGAFNGFAGGSSVASATPAAPARPRENWQQYLGADVADFGPDPVLTSSTSPAATARKASPLAGLTPQAETAAPMSFQPPKAGETDLGQRYAMGKDQRRDMSPLAALFKVDDRIGAAAAGQYQQPQQAQRRRIV